MIRKLLVLWLMVFAANLAAEDRIVMRTASGSRIGMPCVILDYTGREATYQSKPGGPTKRLPRGEIVEVSTHYTPKHLEAKQLLADGAAKDAFSKLDEALDQENRVWVRRQILALQVQCALWNGDRATAGERFLAIVDSDPVTLYFSLMPLSWSEDPPAEDLARIAKRWLSQTTDSTARLLAASHLLTEPDQAAAALTALKVLARDENAEVQRLAQIQLWRARVLTEDVSRDDLLRWEQTFDEAGEELGGGPRYLLGLGWFHRKDDTSAAAAWLWLPYVSGEDRWLAAQAAWQAGQALERAGQPAEGKAVFEELDQRYADTPSGKLAKRRVEQK